MFAVIYIPNFSLQAVLRHDPALKRQPAALLTEDKTAAVWQMNEAARKAGVQFAMSSTQALARCPDIAFRQRRIAQEEAAQQTLLQCAYTFAAFIESTAPGICTMDLRGLPAPIGSRGWEPRARALLDGLSSFHLDAQIGIAATPALALQVAQRAAPILYIEDACEFQKSLPVQNLSASAQVLDVLHRWGITTVEQFLALGKDRISARLGSEGVQLYEQASADTLRPLNLTVPAPVYAEYFEYEQEVETLEPLLFMLRRFLEQLSRRVSLIGQVIEELFLALHLASAKDYEHAYRVPAPTSDVEVLFRILHNHLETIRTDAPIRAITLRASPCAAISQQFELFETAVRDPNRFFETIGCLSALLGEGRVGTPIIKDSHRPDDFAVGPIALEKPRAMRKTETSRRGLALRRLRPPLSINVRVRDQQPESIQGPKASGIVVDIRGPWRSSGDWWEKSWAREEWDVATKDGLYRVFREGENWYLEGVYD